MPVTKINHSNFTAYHPEQLASSTKVFRVVSRRGVIGYFVPEPLAKDYLPGIEQATDGNTKEPTNRD